MRGRLLLSLYWLTFGFYFLAVAMIIYLMFRDGARWPNFLARYSDTLSLTRS